MKNRLRGLLGGLKIAEDEKQVHNRIQRTRIPIKRYVTCPIAHMPFLKFFQHLWAPYRLTEHDTILKMLR